MKDIDEFGELADVNVLLILLLLLIQVQIAKIHFNKCGKSVFIKNLWFSFLLTLLDMIQSNRLAIFISYPAFLGLFDVIMYLLIPHGPSA